ncbi:hypothetical protein UT300013_33600 [Paraclostridium sordellii]
MFKFLKNLIPVSGRRYKKSIEELIKDIKRLECKVNFKENQYEILSVSHKKLEIENRIIREMYAEKEVQLERISMVNISNISNEEDNILDTKKVRAHKQANLK